MWSFLSSLFRGSDAVRSILIYDEGSRTPVRQFKFKPRKLRTALVLYTAGITLVIAVVVIFLPTNALQTGISRTEIRNNSRLTLARLASLEDSLEMQRAYVEQLRRLITGEIDTSTVTASRINIDGSPSARADGRYNAEPLSQNRTDHEQPAWPITHVPVASEMPLQMISDGGWLSRLPLPAQPPVTGFLSRGFDAATGHYAIDIATEEGSLVRSIGDGYVILADWTQKGGYSIAVQHADGVVSVYKHNARLLKRVADRVSLREAIALSGNSGEYTTGPHLHFELWNNGLAQDPRMYLLGM